MSQIVKNWTIPTRGVGLPDYSTSAPLGQVNTGAKLYTSNDSGELAARLGGYQSIDRRGNVALHDNFESGIEAWAQTLGGGAGSACEWSTESYRSGGYSLKLSGGLGSMSGITRLWAVNEPGKTGYEFSFAAQFFEQIAGLGFYSDGVTQYYTYWILLNTELYIYTEAAVELVIDDVELLFDDTIFNTIKLVWDPAQSRYERILFNQVEVNLSQHRVPTLPAVVTGKHMYNQFMIDSRAAANDHAYIDDFIATINEPANT